MIYRVVSNTWIDPLFFEADNSQSAVDMAVAHQNGILKLEGIQFESSRDEFRAHPDADLPHDVADEDLFEWLKDKSNA